MVTISPNAKRVSAQHRRLRIGIFLEENLFIGARKAGKRVEFAAILGMARSLGDVVHAGAYFSYDAYRSAGSALNPMWMSLRHTGFAVDAKPRATTGSGDQKSRVDVDLAFAIGRVTFTKGLDLVVLGTGDGDFANLVRELGSAGVATVLLCPGKGRTSPDLLLAATTFFDVDELRDMPDALMAGTLASA